MVEEDGTVSVASDIRKRTDNNKKGKDIKASIDAEMKNNTKHYKYHKLLILCMM